jgi:hypothetical protein
MKTIQEIKKEGQDKLTELFNECGVFFAFSNEQFQENKTPLKEGEKYVSMGAGGYLPKGNVQTYLDGHKAITKWEKAEIKAAKEGKEQHILYELQNHECFYTGDIEDAMPVLPYPRKDVWKVFLANKERCQQF